MTTDQYQFYKKDCNGHTPRYSPKCDRWATLGNDNCWKDPCDEGQANKDRNQGHPAYTRRQEEKVEEEESGTALYSRDGSFYNDDEEGLEKRCESGICNNGSTPWWDNWNKTPGEYVNFPTGHCKKHCDVKRIHRVDKDKCQQVHYKHQFKFYLKVKAFCYIKDTQKSDECANKHGGTPYNFDTLHSS